MSICVSMANSIRLKDKWNPIQSIGKHALNKKQEITNNLFNGSFEREGLRSQSGH